MPKNLVASPPVIRPSPSEFYIQLNLNKEFLRKKEHKKGHVGEIRTPESAQLNHSW